METNPSSVTAFANIFSPKLLHLIRSNLFIFDFNFHYSGRWIKKYCCHLCQRMFYLCFPLNSFIVFGLTFSSLIHFKLILCSIKGWSNFYVLTLTDLSADAWGCVPSRLVVWLEVTQHWSLQAGQWG